MKKAKLILLLFIISTPLFSQDLWNGLKSGMSYEEVKQIVSKNCGIDLKDNKQWHREKTELLIGDAYESSYDSEKTWVETLYFLSRNSEYDRAYLEEHRNYTDAELSKFQANKFHYNIICQFYEGKLFSVSVRWATSLNALKLKADKKFGLPKTSNDYSYLYRIENSNVSISICNLNIGSYVTDPEITGYFVIDTSVPKKIKKNLTDAANSALSKQREQEAQNADKIKF